MVLASNLLRTTSLASFVPSACGSDLPTSALLAGRLALVWGRSTDAVAGVLLPRLAGWCSTQAGQPGCKP